MKVRRDLTPPSLESSVDEETDEGWQGQSLMDNVLGSEDKEQIMVPQSANGVETTFEEGS